jgi:hypothetical protein
MKVMPWLAASPRSGFRHDIKTRALLLNADAMFGDAQPEAKDRDRSNASSEFLRTEKVCPLAAD